MTKVMVFGTFDILHAGHVALFKQAKKYGDYLIVVVGRDSIVSKIKKHKPVHSETERRLLLNHLDLVDEAVLGDTKDMYKMIRVKKPDVIALGYDQHVFVDKLLEKIASFGLTTKVVRLKPYKKNRHTSTNIKAYIARLV